MTVKKVAVVASAAVAASSFLLLAQPASGALVTRCTGEGGAVTVPGDLLVPRDSSCTLQGTTVLGNVRVARGGDLLAEGVTVEGNLLVTSGAYADVIASTVGGTVQGRSQYGVFIEDTTVSGGVDQRDPQGAGLAPFVYAFEADIDGGVSARAGELLLESTTVGGDVFSTGGVFVDVVDSTLAGGLTVRGSSRGSVVCESEVYGDAVYTGNAATLQIGGSGATSSCDGPSFWGGDVTFVDNTADVTGFDISNNIVAGDLAGSGNDPLPTGTGNRVRGETTLEFAEVAGPARSSLRSRSLQSQAVQSESIEAAQSRVAEVQAKIDVRRAAAAADAARTPRSQALVPGNG